MNIETLISIYPDIRNWDIRVIKRPNNFLCLKVNHTPFYISTDHMKVFDMRRALWRIMGAEASVADLQIQMLAANVKLDKEIMEFDKTYDLR